MKINCEAFLKYGVALASHLWECFRPPSAASSFCRTTDRTKSEHVYFINGMLILLLHLRPSALRARLLPGLPLAYWFVFCLLLWYAEYITGINDREPAFIVQPLQFGHRTVKLPGNCPKTVAPLHRIGSISPAFGNIRHNAILVKGIRCTADVISAASGLCKKLIHFR